MMQKLLTVVIPVFNEEETIEKIINKVIKASLPIDWNKEIIVVNDNSNDNTYNLLKKYQDKCIIINRQNNGGKGIAVKDGLVHANGDYVVIQDADLEYDPNDYVEMLKPVINGESDVVFGSRNLGQNNIPYSFFYFYGGIFLTKIFNLFFKTKLTDFSTCYKLFSREYIPEILKINQNGFAFDAVDLNCVLAKNNIAEVPISYFPRKKNSGKKLKIKDGIKILFRIIKLGLTKKYEKSF